MCGRQGLRSKNTIDVLMTKLISYKAAILSDRKYRVKTFEQTLVVFYPGSLPIYLFIYFWMFKKYELPCFLLHFVASWELWMLTRLTEKKKTIHANLPPQTGVQLGQSGEESSGVERVQRSPYQSPDCSCVIYSSRTMTAAWVSADGEPLKTAPAQKALTHLTFVHWCAYMHERGCRCAQAQELPLTKVTGINPCQVYSVFVP